MTDPGLKLASKDGSPTTPPPRPPTELERQDTVIKWLSALLANLNITSDQGEVFPELKAAMQEVSVVVKQVLKKFL